MPTEFPLTQIAVGRLTKQGPGLRFIPRWEHKAFTIVFCDKELSLCFEALADYQRQERWVVLQLHAHPIGIRTLKFGSNIQATPNPDHPNDKDPTNGEIYKAYDIKFVISDAVHPQLLEALDRALARALSKRPSIVATAVTSQISSPSSSADELDTVSSDIDRLNINDTSIIHLPPGSSTTTTPSTLASPYPVYSRRSFAVEAFNPAAYPFTEQLTVSLANLAQGYAGTGNSSVPSIASVPSIPSVPFIPSVPSVSPAPSIPSVPSVSAVPPAHPSSSEGPVFNATSPFIAKVNGNGNGTGIPDTQYAALVAAALKYFVGKSKEEEEYKKTEKRGDGVSTVLNRHLPPMLRVICNFQHDTRVLMLAGSVTFSDMLAHLERKFRINNPVYMSVRYRDSKGRQVFVADEEDWSVAKHLAKAESELELWCSMEQGGSHLTGPEREVKEKVR